MCRDLAERCIRPIDGSQNFGAATIDDVNGIIANNERKKVKWICVIAETAKPQARIALFGHWTV